MAFTSTVPVPYIDATGCHVPAFEDILTAWENDFRSIYGADTNLDSDTQDGEWIGLLATAYNAACAAFQQSWAARSPNEAQGTGLSSIVKLNGISRKVASYSTVTETIVGVAGTVITNGVVGDGTYLWSLPSEVTIPLSGTIDVTAICQTLGAVQADIGQVNIINNPTRGWQTASNAAQATPGNPVETDPQLRIRQSESTEIPALSVIGGLKGALLAIPGVVTCEIYENDTDNVDANGIPGNCISVVIDGGDLQTIINTIGLKKGPGVGTYGNTVGTYTDTAGSPKQVAYFVPNKPPITYQVTLKALDGFTTDIQAQIAAVLSNWTNSLGANQNVLRTKAFVPANLSGKVAIDYFLANGATSYTSAAALAIAASETFEVQDIAIARDGNTPTPADVMIAFNEEADCDPSYVAITVTT